MLRWGTRVKPGTVSNINKKIYKRIEGWRNRPIEGDYPYVYLDGILFKRRCGGEVRNRTNNPLERTLREVRRRTQAIGAFPDGNSALMLVCARLRHMASTKWGKRRYLNIDLLKDTYTDDQVAI